MSYIGQAPGLGEAERFIFTASGGETSVTADDNGVLINYTVGQLSVYLNGVKLVMGSDFTATNGSTIAGLSALTASDVVEVIALSTFSPADTVPASGGTFTGNVVMSGNLTVNGTTVTLNTQTVEVEDNILQLNTTQGSPDTATAATSGISIYRGNGVTQASLIFDDADDTWDITNNLKVAGSIQTGDLILNSLDNKEGNEVNGTKGHWCIQEGENDLFIMNRVTNKKYKFKLEEIA